MYKHKITVYFNIFFIVNYCLLCSINCLFFKEKNMEFNINDLGANPNKEESLGSSKECLVSVDEAKKILQEKYNINPEHVDINENMSFILGKCNPIFVMSALYATRLVITINCPVFQKNFLQFVKMRLFCRNTVCPDEEYVLFPAISDSPFQIRVTENVNKYTACQGYFFNYFNSSKECPEGNC